MTAEAQRKTANGCLLKNVAAVKNVWSDVWQREV